MLNRISQLRELEMAHHEKLTEVAMVTLEKIHKSELEEDMSEEMKLVSTCHLHSLDDEWP